MGEFVIQEIDPNNVKNRVNFDPIRWSDEKEDSDTIDNRVPERTHPSMMT